MFVYYMLYLVSMFLHLFLLKKTVDCNPFDQENFLDTQNKNKWTVKKFGNKVDQAELKCLL